MGMSNTYLVNWSDEGIDEAKEYKCDSPEKAYIEFLKEVSLLNSPVGVWSKVDKEFEEFDAHMKPSDQISVSIADATRAKQYCDNNPSDQTQLEILSQLKQINWAIRIGFLFIMAVVAGIIKPGIFG